MRLKLQLSSATQKLYWKYVASSKNIFFSLKQNTCTTSALTFRACCIVSKKVPLSSSLCKLLFSFTLVCEIRLALKTKKASSKVRGYLFFRNSVARDLQLITCLVSLKLIEADNEDNWLSLLLNEEKKFMKLKDDVV